MKGAPGLGVMKRSCSGNKKAALVWGRSGEAFYEGWFSLRFLHQSSIR